jgi:hypothetical protein
MKYQLIDYDLIKIEDEDGVEYGYAKLDLLGDDGDRYYCDTPLYDPVWERGYYNFLAGTGKVVRILARIGKLR